MLQPFEDGVLLNDLKVLSRREVGSKCFQCLLPVVLLPIIL